MTAFPVGPPELPSRQGLRQLSREVADLARVAAGRAGEDAGARLRAVLSLLIMPVLLPVGLLAMVADRLKWELGNRFDRMRRD